MVPGDLVEVSVGARIPADIRLTKFLSNAFGVDQAILTGESYAVRKQLEPVNDLRAVNQDKVNILFSVCFQASSLFTHNSFKGTHVSVGKARGVVVGTGLRTAIGDIKRSLMEMDQQMSPLKRKIDEFGDMLSKVITVICVLVWVINIGHFADPEHGSIVRGAV